MDTKGTNMTPQEIREYNKIVIEVAEQTTKPWKWTTFILSCLLAGMICLYFFNPSVVEVDQSFDTNNSSNIINNQKG